MSIQTHQHNWFTEAGERRDTCRVCALPIHAYLDELTARKQELESAEAKRLNALEARISALERQVVKNAKPKEKGAGEAAQGSG